MRITRPKEIDFWQAEHNITTELPLLLVCIIHTVYIEDYLHSIRK